MTRRSYRAETAGGCLGVCPSQLAPPPRVAQSKSESFFFLVLSSSPVVLLRPGEDPRLSEHFIAPFRPPIKPPINSFRNSTRRLVRPRRRRRRRRLWMWMCHPEEPQKYLCVYDVLFREDNKTFRLRRWRRSSNGGVKRCRHSILYRSCGRAERKRKTPHLKCRRLVTFRRFSIKVRREKKKTAS